MRHIKQFFIFLAKVVTVILTIATFALIIISFVRKEWILVAIEWIGRLIETLGNWNYLVAFASACIESLPIIGTAVP
jgi:hypothetical protein